MRPVIMKCPTRVDEADTFVTRSAQGSNSRRVYGRSLCKISRNPLPSLAIARSCSKPSRTYNALAACFYNYKVRVAGVHQ